MALRVDKNPIDFSLLYMRDVILMDLADRIHSEVIVIIIANMKNFEL
jgi:hypothetical protein